MYSFSYKFYHVAVYMTETLYSLVKVIATTELTQLWISCGQLEVNLQQPSTT